MPLNESQLVNRAKNGDTRAFGELVMAHQGFVYNLALRAVGNPDEAEDAAQEALVRAWKALPDFRGDSLFRTWLYRIVINQCYNRRPRLRREAAEFPLEKDEDFLVHPGESPERLAEASERRALLQQAIDRLPPSYRLLVMFRFQQDMAYDEIAEVMNLPLGTVKTGLFRAKALLRQSLVNREEVIE